MLFEDNIPYNIAKVLLIVIGTLGMMYSTTSFKYTIKQMVPLIILYLFYVAGSSTAIIVLLGYTCFMRVLLTISFPVCICEHYFIDVKNTWFGNDGFSDALCCLLYYYFTGIPVSASAISADLCHYKNRLRLQNSPSLTGMISAIDFRRSHIFWKMKKFRRLLTTSPGIPVRFRRKTLYHTARMFS